MAGEVQSRGLRVSKTIIQVDAKPLVAACLRDSVNSFVMSCP